MTHRASKTVIIHRNSISTKMVYFTLQREKTLKKLRHFIKIKFKKYIIHRKKRNTTEVKVLNKSLIFSFQEEAQKIVDMLQLWLTKILSKLSFLSY